MMGRARRSEAAGGRFSRRGSYSLLVAAGVLALAGSRAPAAPAPSDDAPPRPSPAVSEILHRVGTARAQGHPDEALRAADEALALAAKTGDHAGEAIGHGMRADLWDAKHDLERTAAEWSETAACWGRAGDPPMRMDALGRVLFWIAPESPRAKEIVAELLRFTSGTNSARGVANVVHVGIRVLGSGRVIEAAQLIEAAQKRCAEIHLNGPTTVLTLTEAAIIARMQADPARAVQYLDEARSQLERGQSYPPLLSAVLNDLGEAAAAAGRPADAVEWLQRSYLMREQAGLAPDARLRTLAHLSRIHEGLGDASRADEFRRRAEAYPETEPAESWERAGLLETLADQEPDWHAGDRVLPLREEAVAIRRKQMRSPEQTAEFVRSLLRLTRARLGAGKKEEARQSAQEAVRQAEGASLDAALRTELEDDQGMVAEGMGNLAEAREHYRRAVTICEQTAPFGQHLGLELMKLCGVEGAMGDEVASWTHANRALSLMEASDPQSRFIPEAQRRVANTLIMHGDLEAAEPLLRKALARANEESPTFAGILRDIAGIQARRREYAQALVTWKRTRDAIEKYRPGSLDSAVILLFSAATTSDSGKPQEAVELFREGIAQFDRAGVEDVNLAQALGNQSGCLRRLDRLDEAEQACRRALAICEKVAPGSDPQAHALMELSLILRLREKRSEAARHAREAWQIYSRHSDLLTDDEERQRSMSSQAPLVATALTILLDAGEKEAALQILEESRAQALRRALLHDTHGEAGTVPPAVWNAYCAARSTREKAESAYASAGDAKVQAHEALEGAQRSSKAGVQLTALERSCGDADQQFQLRNDELLTARLKESQLAAQVGTRMASVDRPDFAGDLRAAASVIRDGSLLLYFSVTNEETVLFTVQAGAQGSRPRVEAYRIPIHGWELEKQIDRWKAAIRDARAEAGPQSRQLFRLLFPGRAGAEVARARRVIVVPDGPLWEMPFGALGLPEASPAEVSSAGDLPRYLGLLKPFSRVPSLALLRRAEPKPEKPAGRPRVLAVGDPEFARRPDRVARAVPAAVRGLDASLPEPKPLPGTRIDAVEIARIYGGEPLLGSSATEEAVRSRLPGADIVHLATHGYSHPYWAGASRIYLAGALPGARTQDAAHDGLLEAWEISSQFKLRADLVVLAACETDLGHFIPGEGVDGLTRALLRAGAHTVLASQWEVRDDSTRALSIEFHRGIRAGLAKDEALRRARVAVARHPGWEHPYYWAPFTLTGDRENRLFSARPAVARSSATPRKRGP